VAYRIRETTHTPLYGSMKDHHCNLGRYIEELKRSNAASTFITKTDPNIVKEIPTFQSFFVCLNGLKNGFVGGCRHVLCIDASLLNTFFGGILLFAIGIDGNNQMFPLRCAVAVGENNDSCEGLCWRYKW